MLVGCPVFRIGAIDQQPRQKLPGQLPRQGRNRRKTGSTRRRSVPNRSDGPFVETRELIAGYWIIKVDSKQDAIEWAKRAPAPHGKGQEGEIEIRQFFELEDFEPSPAIDRERELEKGLAKKK